MAERSFHNNQKQLRGDAVASLDELRKKLEISPMKTPNRRQRMADSKSSPYSASVERLREILKRQEKSSSQRKSSTSDTSLHMDFPPPGELVPLLNDQNNLLQHLEAQVSYYKGALDSLKQKAEIVISENNRLHEQIVSEIQEDIGDLDEQKSMQEVAPKDLLIDCATQTEKCNQKDRGNSPLTELHKRTDSTDTVFENVVAPDIFTVADIARNEASAKRSDDRIGKLKDVHPMKTIGFEATVRNLNKTDAVNNSASNQELERPGMCIKCAHNKAVLSGFRSGGNEKVLQRITRENEELLETISKQRNMLEGMKKKELEAFLQVKKSCELAEEIQLQNQETAIKYQLAVKEIDRLKEESKKQAAKANDVIHNERVKMQIECEENKTKELCKLDEFSEKLLRAEMQVERVTREKQDLKISMTKLEEYSEGHDAEMIQRLDEMRQSFDEVSKKSSLLQEQNQRLERDKKYLEMILEKKNVFSNDEVTSLRRRLAELTESRSIFDQNFIQLTEALENSKKQFQSESILRNQEKAVYTDQIEQLKSTHEKQTEKLLKSLHETEEDYETTKSELGSMLESQIELCNNFKSECRKLLEKNQEIEKASRQEKMKLSCENRALIDENVALKSEKMALAAQLPELQSQIRILEQSLAQAEIQTKAFSEKTISLLSKYKVTLKERQHLREEVNFLKNQLLSRNTNKISISDLESAHQPH